MQNLLMVFSSASSVLTSQTYLTGFMVAAYSAIVGAVWGMAVRRFTRPVDQYGQFEVGRVGVGILGTLVWFEWLVRIPIAVLSYPESLFHLTTGWWVQVWIAAFAAGGMGGYNLGRHHFTHEPIPIKAGLVVKDDGVILVKEEETSDLPKNNGTQKA